LGSSEVKLKNLSDGTTLEDKSLGDILDLLSSLDKFAVAIRRHGGDFADYLEHRSDSGSLPRHLVKIRAGNEEFVHFFKNEEELAAFGKENLDLGLFGESESEDVETERTRGQITRRARHVELHESKAIEKLLNQLTESGLNVEHYSAQDNPLYELIEGEGEKQQAKPLFSIAEILESIKEVGQRGLEIKRFKGLGEMNPKQLFETTMDPATRKLLKVDLTDAVEAEEMFTKLMGDEVEPRRQFIEDNALNVRNLDV
jgi:DNA gyrase subunit B